MRNLGKNKGNKENLPNKSNSACFVKTITIYAT